MRPLELTIEQKVYWLEDRLMALQKEVDELKALLNGDLVTLPKIDMGVAVNLKEKQAISDIWPDDERIDVIGSNGNDGDHYA